VPSHRTRTATALLTRLAIAAGLVCACCGCVVETTRRNLDTPSRLVLSDQNESQTSRQVETLTSAGVMKETRLSSSFTFEPLCVTDYDGFTLPIFAPAATGDLFATQEGDRPRLDVLMGDSNLGMTNQPIAIHRLTSEQDLELVARHPGPLLLGRNANAEGVLVERPNANGSRSIGIASWSKNSVRWLVDDDAVNAFGWISESGRLVYSSRETHESAFRLHVLETDGTTWEIFEPLPYSWVLPTMTMDGRGIFAIRMGDGYGDLAWGSSESPGEFRRTRKIYRMSERFTPGLAWQTLASTTGGSGVSDTEIAWYSFDLQRLTLWNGQKNTIRILPPDALACGCLSGEDEWLITTPDCLERIRIMENSTPKTRLLSGPWINRRSTKNGAFVVKANDRMLEIGRLSFTKSPVSSRQSKDEDRTSQEYRYNIRD